MVATALLSRVKQLVTAVGSAGVGTLSLGAAYDATVLRFDDVATTGATYPYMIKEGNKWEYGKTVVTSGTPWTLARTTCIRSSAGPATKETFTSACVVWCVPNEADFSERDARGLHCLPLSASALTSNTTNGPSTTRLETSTNKVMVPTLDFDATTEESAFAVIPMPPSWDGGVIYLEFDWKHLSGSGGVVWSGSAVCIPDASALDVAMGTAQQIADTGGTANSKYATGRTPAITVGGTPAGGNLMFLRIARKPADASDTMAVDAQLIAARLYYTTNAVVDV